MKKFFAGAFACLALCNTAQAAIYTFEYTAVVSKLDEAPSAGGWGTRISVTSSTVAGSAISVGDKVTGVISYDPEGRTPGSGNYLASLNLTARFAAAGIHFTPDPDQYRWAGTLHGYAEYGSIDEFYAGAYRYTTLPNGQMAQEVLTVELGDSTSTKISDKLPGAEATGFDSKSLTYEFGNLQLNQRLYVNSTITELKFISTVPEPETYAMLLAGLAVIGWNRRRKAATV